MCVCKSIRIVCVCVYVCGLGTVGCVCVGGGVCKIARTTVDMWKVKLIVKLNWKVKTDASQRVLVFYLYFQVPNKILLVFKSSKSPCDSSSDYKINICSVWILFFYVKLLLKLMKIKIDNTLKKHLKHWKHLKVINNSDSSMWLILFIFPQTNNKNNTQSTEQNNKPTNKQTKTTRKKLQWPFSHLWNDV